MKRRLVWNFEIQELNDPQLTFTADNEHDLLRWEARYFWPEDAIITLYHLSDSFLELSQYQFKHHKDHYYLLKGYPFNLKIRREEVLYKPLLKERNGLHGFGEKYNLDDLPDKTVLPGTSSLTARQLRHFIRKEATPITVEKDALVYKLEADPTIKLELSRLIINHVIYFSACIEGHNEQLVRCISQQLLNQPTARNYVQFLKNILNHD